MRTSEPLRSQCCVESNSPEIIINIHYMVMGNWRYEINRVAGISSNRYINSCTNIWIRWPQDGWGDCSQLTKNEIVCMFRGQFAAEFRKLSSFRHCGLKIDTFLYAWDSFLNCQWIIFDDYLEKDKSRRRTAQSSPVVVAKLMKFGLQLLKHPSVLQIWFYNME